MSEWYHGPWYVLKVFLLAYQKNCFRKNTHWYYLKIVVTQFRYKTNYIHCLIVVAQLSMTFATVENKIWHQKPCFSKKILSTHHDQLSTNTSLCCQSFYGNYWTLERRKSSKRFVSPMAKLNWLNAKSWASQSPGWWLQVHHQASSTSCSSSVGLFSHAWAPPLDSETYGLESSGWRLILY